MNSLWPADTPATRLICTGSMLALVICFFFFPLVFVGVWMKMCEKGGIVLKPVRRRCIRDCWLTVWSLMMSGQVLAGWLLNEVFQKTTCWDDSTEGNWSACKPLVITQPILKQDGGKMKPRQKSNFNLGIKKAGKIRKHERKFQGLP